MRHCELLVSRFWSDSVVLHLGGLYSSLKIGVLQHLIVLFLLIYMLRLIQVTLVMLGRLTIRNIEIPPPLFVSVVFYFLVESLMSFPIGP